PDIIRECLASVTNKPTARDNCAGTITGTTSYSLTYKSQDTHTIPTRYSSDIGNSTTQKQNVIVKDSKPPVPVVDALPDIIGECSASVTNKQTARDNCAGTITGTTTDSLTYKSQGSHTITWTYDDGNGNISTQK